MDKKEKNNNKSKTEDDICLQYAVTVPLNHKEFELDAERVSNNKPFINRYSWDGIKYPSKK